MIRLSLGRVTDRSTVAIAVASALLGIAAHAAAADSGSAATSLPEIIVTAKKQQLKTLEQGSIYDSAYGDKALDRQQLKSAGVVGGAARALSFAPGISVSGYGQTGGTKASISVNGVSQGWAGVSPGTVDNGSLAISFDGIPMVNAATGLWETPQIPQTALLQGARVTYGPGDPENRWYNNIGGGVNFVPVQPRSEAGGSFQLSYGSYNTQNTDLILQTGNLGGWETVIAGGFGRANNFRKSPDGFAWGSRNFAAFVKTSYVFSKGNVSFGAYLGDGHGWRPVPIPLNPISGLSINGANQPGPLLSINTTGLYSVVNENVWRKQDYNRTWILYARQNIQLDEHIVLHNQTWYRQGNRLHYHYNNFGAALGTVTNLYEDNNPYSHMYGDKLWSNIYLPYNTIGIGGYFINTVYDSRNAFYNPAVCVTTPQDITLSDGTLVPSGTQVCGSPRVPNDNHRSDFWNITDLAAFVQDTISPVEGVSITPGVRMVDFNTDYYPYGPTEFQLADILSQPTPSNPNGLGLFGGLDQGRLPASKTHYHKIEPSVSARFQVQPWLALYGNWATAYRLPNVGGGGGLYQKSPVGGNILEKGQEYQAGFKMFWPEVGAFQRVLINMNYYHLNYSNEIIGVNSSGGDFLGLGTGNSIYHGINFSAEANYGPVKMFANINSEKAYFSSYIFTKPNGTVDTNYSGLPVSDMPETTFNIGAYWTHKIGNGMLIKPRAWYQYVGKQYIFDNYGTAADNGLVGPTHQSIPGYGVLNLALAATLPPSSYGTIKLKLEVMNALGHKYYQFAYISAGGLYQTAGGGYTLYYPGAPRSVYGTISVSF